MVMRFPAKKNPVAQKHCTISRQEKMAFSTPGRVVLGLPSPSLESVRTDGRTDGRTYRALTSQPKFFGSIGYQICLAMELRWRALPAGSAMIAVGHNRNDCWTYSPAIAVIVAIIWKPALIRGLKQPRQQRQGKHHLTKGLPNISNFFAIVCEDGVTVEVEKKKMHCLVFTFYMKIWIWSFHVVVLQRTAKKCTKTCIARAESLFCYVEQWGSRENKTCCFPLGPPLSAY